MKYARIWSNLEKETKANGKPKFQTPNNKCITEILFTLDVDTLIRSILIELNQVEVKQIARIPEINGWSYSVESKKISGKPKKYLKITANLVYSTAIAEIVIDNLVLRIFSLKKRDLLIDTITKVLKEWKLFFSSTEILNKTTEQGLVGELSWLNLMIREGVNTRTAIEHWTGSEKTRHDFELDDLHFEIKSTSRNNRHIKISSEHQLNNKGLKKLYLVVYKYNVFSSKMPSLPELYDEAMGLALNESDLLNRIIEQCAKLGYNHTKKGLYTNRFELDGEVEIYSVVKEFPKLLKTPKMIGIYDISYSLDLDTCQKFRIDKSNVFPL